MWAKLIKASKNPMIAKHYPEAQARTHPDASIQMSGQNPIQRPGQKPIQMPGQNPIQRPGQNPVQMPGQNPIQMPGQNPIQVPRQCPGQTSGMTGAHSHSARVKKIEVTPTAHPLHRYHLWNDIPVKNLEKCPGI